MTVTKLEREAIWPKDFEEQLGFGSKIYIVTFFMIAPNILTQGITN